MDAIGKILAFTKPFKKFYLIMAGVVTILGLLNQVAPILTKQIVDIIVARLKGQPAELRNILIFLGLILSTDIVITIMTDISQYYSDVMTAKLNNYLTERFYKHVLSLSVDYFDSEVTGRILSKLDRGITNIVNLISQMANNFLPLIVSTVITLLIIGLYSWELALLLCILFPLYIFISHKSSVVWVKKESEKNAIIDATSGRALEALSSIRVVKSFVQEIIELLAFTNKRKEIIGITRAQSKHWHIYDFYRRIALNLIMFGVFGYVIYFTFRGRFSLGEMTLLLQLANQARFPLFAMSFIIGQIQQAQAGSKDFFAVLATLPSIHDKAHAKQLKKVKGNIVFNNVSFSYGKNNGDVLKQISFSLRSGEKMAIVGESGEGKSTIANLLLRFYEPQAGIITIDGTSIADVTQQSLRRHIGVVFQETFLFSGSIRENIRYSRIDATDAEVEQVAHMANADGFIRAFPNGYDTEIGERGIKLSGGQKQRIAIARALLKNPPILIFDEATSSLDSKSEFEVQKALNKLMEGRTTIIIAHRLSTIKHVDTIIVIKNGTIVEQGKPKDLEKQKGVYAELLSYQELGPKSEETLKELHMEIE